MEFSDAPAESVLNANTPESAFERKAAQWAVIKARVDTQTSMLNKLRDDMSADLRTFGVKDDKGSYIIELPAALSVGDKRFKGMKLERTTTQVADEEVAESIAHHVDSEEAESAAAGDTDPPEATVYDRLFPLVRQFDPQEAYVLYQEGRLSDADMEHMFPEKEGWRFVRVAA
ncbi:hypothetical protein ACFWAP_00485 [Streptomyces goshikiensis]|uniref:hypothetical protein n=1 Tax=Streptomyces goshikiensis TaxID=1942 RepID=UPI0036491B51